MNYLINITQYDCMLKTLWNSQSNLSLKIAMKLSYIYIVLLCIESFLAKSIFCEVNFYDTFTYRVHMHIFFHNGIFWAFFSNFKVTVCW